MTNTTQDQYIVHVYSRPGCQPCKATKKFLTRNNIQYRDHNIDDDVVQQLRIQDWGFTQLPVVEVTFDGETIAAWSGLRLDHLKAIRDRAVEPEHHDMRVQ